MSIRRQFRFGVRNLGTYTGTLMFRCTCRCCCSSGTTPVCCGGCAELYSQEKVR